MIQKGDITFHSYSGLYYRCENTQMARWMNEARDIFGTATYTKTNLPEGYIL